MSAINQVTINLPAGFWMSWLVTAQCCYDQNVALVDGSATVFSASKPTTSSPNFIVLTQAKTQSDLHQITSGAMTLTIQSVQTASYVKYMYKYEIIDPSTGNTMGQVYDLFFEDKESDPKSIDFNDVAIHLVALRSNS